MVTERERLLSLVVPNSARAAVAARRRVMLFLKNVGIENAGLLDDVGIAVGEALANAAEHGHRPAGSIRVEARCHADAIEIVVTDDGCGFAAPPGPLPVPDVQSPRGFGLFLMHTLMDEVEFRDDGRTVRFMKYLAAASDES